jgi:hypothetical protein
MEKEKPKYPHSELWLSSQFVVTAASATAIEVYAEHQPLFLALPIGIALGGIVANRFKKHLEKDARRMAAVEKLESSKKK